MTEWEYDESEREDRRVLEQTTQEHDLDEDACCNRCGFDAAEWWHLERQKPKGERDPQPSCTRGKEVGYGK